MTTEKAYNITRPFINRHRKVYPRSYSNIEIYQQGHKYITMKLETGTYRFLGQNLFKKKYLNNENLNLENIKEDNFLSYLIKEDLYHTSIGLVSPEEFHLAEDIIENIQRITPKNLETGKKYKSISGKRYIALGDIEYKENFLGSGRRMFLKNILYDIKSERIVKAESIKLVEEQGYIDQKYNINFFKEFYLTHIHLKMITTIKNIEFI